ncbi:MAG: pyruvate:ferredoxin (flavodoxin) oxidoreductase [Clostridiaceae bacterium]|nr:pyruvate:ferredoxin (flavodoxin) oxidoreductase [Clostridiaceae bacterium]
MAKTKKFLTMDGNEAAAYTSYAFTEVAGIYPITPSSPMADFIDKWSVQGRENIFGSKVDVIEMQSEAGAAGVVHGSLATGALTTTYTASQGLLLMLPNMYKIAGELLPGVFHVSARALASHALSIFGDHSDVMATRQTGFALLAAANVQEVTDLAAVAHLAAIKGRVPFLHFFDGFRTSHEIQKVEVQDYADFADLVDFDAIKEFRQRSLNPTTPVQRGTAQNPDIFFQVREASNPFYLAIPAIVEQYMDQISKLTGREYHLFNYYGDENADRVIVAMGSICDTVRETVDFLNARGEHVGLLNVHLYRPFATDRFLKALPESVEKIAVLDRTKEPGALGEPLYLDVVAAYSGTSNPPTIVGGRYGLGSKDTTPDDVLAVFKNLNADSPKHGFTISINDDVTNLSLPIEETADVSTEGTTACRFWGLGSDGTVGANKNSIKIIGDNTDMYAQAYFSYDSKKSGGVTMSDLRFGHTPIYSPYLINKADFVSCSNQAYVNKYDMLSALKPGGTFLLNTLWKPEELEDHLPASMKRFMAENDINFYIIDAVSIAGELGLGNRTNTVMQSAFFKLTNIIPIDDAVNHMKSAIVKSYGHKGDDIVNMNYGAVDAGVDNVVKIDIPASWKDAKDDNEAVREVPEFIAEITDVMNAQDGDKLPVSAFKGREDGHFPMGTTQYEKRGISPVVPIWIAENCIQCNQCAYVCPHAVIRPFLLTEEEANNAPETATVLDGMKPYDNYKFRIQLSPLDCTGCASCVQTCPAKEKALVLKPFEENVNEVDNWNYMINLPRKENPMKKTMVKGSQFEFPYLEFSGACAGCGETPYAKLVTQLFGNRMQISNATGCSSIWGGSAPSNPYTVDEDGRGPAWANSLFEDNAEHGLGMHLAAKKLHERLVTKVEALAESADGEAKAAIDAYLADRDVNEKTVEVSENLVEAVKKIDTSDADVKKLVDTIIDNKEYLNKRSTWILGGDGWAYDIGYGGLDHVLATGENVNVLVFDTEVYSNTGGQASKATPTGAIAEFAAGGKKLRKKDLGMMAMSYGYVYVAQISMGANQNQTLKALLEAESYEGPSLVIAYAPCINHGIRGGLRFGQERERDAVKCGYWHLYRFDPRLEAEGKNPFTLDSKEPNYDEYINFLKKEVRYSSLMKRYDQEKVDEIFAKSVEDAKYRYNSYKRLAGEC